MLYVDGLVTALPAKNKDIYQKLVNDAVPLIHAYGAIKVVHCSDKPTKQAVIRDGYDAEKGVVVFSWIIWPSREIRDRGMEKILSDPRFDDVMNPASLEGERVDLDPSMVPKFH
ncbi:DUF1428 domain-containing protein [Enterovibrio nigricans]|uniref:Uncharacterized conserved protein YbaA, DUF1428 family n=1 Tax=Enterovibrio nigricans DSM 22720 TaxID=1121868 RepID=A0A1T4VFD7_9GAMM|nr:DUF1428 domain-containing protein [Enterovibrio nigricans]PKF49912.1 DUF1428 domain-containing protein [Enterovibrio nigricans]SKA63231.1 Uncharacterized conserved protein YbaA, DUF1428 family [Enterovibrio nigricans DSM 22720]